MADVAKNYNIKPNIIDPNDSNSIGLNPFTIKAGSNLLLSEILARCPLILSLQSMFSQVYGPIPTLLSDKSIPP